VKSRQLRRYITTFGLESRQSAAGAVLLPMRNPILF